MILDDFKVHSLVVQINFPDAFILWDRAGALASELSLIWGGLSVNEASPQQQSLHGVDVAVHSSLNKCVLTLFRERASLNRSTEKIKDTYEAWCNFLQLSQLNRVSARSKHHKDYDYLRDANDFLFSLGVVSWPSSQVFNQKQASELNSYDLAYRFHDEEAFSVLRVKTERVEFHADLDRDFVIDPIRVEKSRVVIDFDRGTLGGVDSEKLRIEEWLKGYKHLMRRDIGKVLGNG